MITRGFETAAEPPGYDARVRGCLLGGALGDALGAPVEFLSRAQILERTADRGARAFLPAQFGTVTGVGLITDDTQMTLFITEGIIRARVREDRGLGFTVAVTDHALRRWLDTQDHPAPTGRRDGWLQAQQWLYSRRAPGNTCLGALHGAEQERFGGPARNDSKGCGAVMRSAPFGLLAPSFNAATIFDFAVESAGYTHGHPSGQVASGALAHLVAGLVQGASLSDAVGQTRQHLAGIRGHEETSDALTRAVDLAAQAPGSPDAVTALGGGWVAEEALAIAVYCALSHPQPDQVLDALSLAVTHSGDSDSTGAICGNILGTAHSAAALPPDLIFQVEGRGTILELADDFVLEQTSGPLLHGDDATAGPWTQRYPGW